MLIEVAWNLGGAARREDAEGWGGGDQDVMAGIRVDFGGVGPGRRRRMGSSRGD
jgi:hypothetical protein